jgi:flagellar FliJ protein
MKRFHFQLQKVLELRKYREEESKIELGRAVGVLSAIESRIREAAEKRHHAARERFNGGDMRNTISISNTGSMQNSFSIIAWDNYIIRLDQEVERLTGEAAQAELVVEEKRERYMEAERDLKVMEKLREKREKEYRKEMFAAETAELDDLRRPHGGKGH